MVGLDVHQGLSGDLDHIVGSVSGDALGLGLREHLGGYGRRRLAPAGHRLAAGSAEQGPQRPRSVVDDEFGFFACRQFLSTAKLAASVVQAQQATLGTLNFEQTLMISGRDGKAHAAGGLGPTLDQVD